MYIFSLIKLIKLLILNSFFLVHLEQRFNKRHSSILLTVYGKRTFLIFILEIIQKAKMI